MDPRILYVIGVLGAVAGVTGELTGADTMAWIGWAIALGGLFAGFLSDRR